MNVLYNRIGETYDMTRKADPEIFGRLCNHLQLSTGKVLDIGCGTGNYTVALHNSGLSLTGIDLSEVMLKQARTKSSEVNWILGNVEELPFSDNSFQGATAILCAHHFNSLDKPFSEVYRTLETGRFVLFTSSPEQTGQYWLKEYFPEAIKEACKQLPAISDIIAHLKDAGFIFIGTESFLIQPNIQDRFLGSGRFHPEIYLRDEIRKGISTFASLANPEEVRIGCERLSRDLESGRFEEVFSRYASEQGDYLFVVAEKRI